MLDPSINQDFAVTKTYSLTMLHIAKVTDLAERLGVSQAEIVRRAIDLLWEQEKGNGQGGES